MIQKLNETVAFLKTKTKISPRVGVTLGSGLSSFAKEIDIDVAIPYSEIPHFAPPTIEGHPGQIIFGTVKNTPVVVLQGRIHFYEGHPLEQVIYPTRTLGKLGVETLVLTNAAGGLDPNMKPGHFLVIKDHINLTGNNPLIGKNLDELGPRFPDMTNPYDLELVGMLESLLKEKNIPHSTGVYCGVTGPTYETAAEVRYLGQIGGHAVGMSTVPETIAARHMGLKVAGISCITNLGTGLSSDLISHDEVKEIANRVEGQFCDFLTAFVEKL